jgi:hypothetical protein
MVVAADLSPEMKEVVLTARGPDQKSITSQAMTVNNTSARFGDDQRQETLVVVGWWMGSGC